MDSIIKAITKEDRVKERKRICKYIRDIRKERGYTLLQVAEQFNLTEASMSRYEKGYTAMSLDMFIALCDFYKILLY